MCVLSKEHQLRSCTHVRCGRAASHLVDARNLRKRPLLSTEVIMQLISMGLTAELWDAVKQNEINRLIYYVVQGMLSLYLL